MKLVDSNLCCQCDEVFEGDQCPSCTSKSFIPLSRIIEPMITYRKTESGYAKFPVEVKSA